MIIAIDPSIRKTGVACLIENGKISDFGQIVAPVSGDDWMTRAYSMARTVSSVIDGIITRHSLNGVIHGVEVISESPEHWNSTRGLDSEASESVQKTYWVAGAILGNLMSMTRIGRISVVRPNAWKGSAPKKIMIARGGHYVQHMSYDPAMMTDDAYEAICLAHWYAAKKAKSIQIYPPVTDNGATITIAEDDDVEPFDHSRD